MTQIKSIFGPYSEKLQVIVDKSKAKFAPLWYPKFFSFAAPQMQLTFTAAIGRARIEAAASIVAPGSSAPIRSRQGLEKYNGEVAAIKEKFKMTETDYRDFLSIQGMNVDAEIKKEQLLELLFGDVKKAGDSAHKRLDIMALEAVSTGKISLTINNNPDGLVLAEPLDLLMNDENKKQASVSWAVANAATSKPITDIQTVVKDAGDRGIMFGKILMENSLWLKFIKSKEVIDTLQAYFYGPKPGTGFNPTAVTTLGNVNTFLSENRLPVIEVVDAPIGIEKDGKISSLRPFNENNVSFIPSGQLGTIKNALAIEEIQKVSNVGYATFNRALISKWQTNDPFAEYTAVELNAFPALDAIDSIYILTAIF